MKQLYLVYCMKASYCHFESCFFKYFDNCVLKLSIAGVNRKSNEFHKFFIWNSAICFSMAIILVLRLYFSLSKVDFDSILTLVTQFYSFHRFTFYFFMAAISKLCECSLPFTFINSYTTVIKMSVTSTIFMSTPSKFEFRT